MIFVFGLAKGPGRFDRVGWTSRHSLVAATSGSGLGPDPAHGNRCARVFAVQHRVEPSQCEQRKVAPGLNIRTTADSPEPIFTRPYRRFTCVSAHRPVSAAPAGTSPAAPTIACRGTGTCV